MFRLPNNVDRCAAGRGPRTVLLRLERLETRDLPAAPAISSFTAVPTNSGTQVLLSGHVNDEHPAGITVNFNGAAMGMTTTNANGDFSVYATSASLGTVTATAQDNEMLTGTATAAISSQVPSITLSISYGAGKSVTFSGTVTDEAPAGRTVTFSGHFIGNTSVNSDGTFSITTTSASLGDVSATVTDAWGQQSNTAKVTVASSAPVITNFRAIQGPDNFWTFTGHVNDESPADLIVRFGGVAGLAGLTATVGSNGDFSLTVELMPGQVGTVTAQTTDWWGLDSNVATAVL